MTTFGDDLYCKTLHYDNLVGPGGINPGDPQDLKSVLATEPGFGVVSGAGDIMLTNGKVTTGAGATGCVMGDPQGSIMCTGNMSAGSGEFKGDLNMINNKIVSTGGLQSDLEIDFAGGGSATAAEIRGCNKLTTKAVTSVAANPLALSAATGQNLTLTTEGAGNLTLTTAATGAVLINTFAPVLNRPLEFVAAVEDGNDSRYTLTSGDKEYFYTDLPAQTFASNDEQILTVTTNYDIIATTASDTARTLQFDNVRLAPIIGDNANKSQIMNVTRVNATSFKVGRQGFVNAASLNLMRPSGAIRYYFRLFRI